MVADQQSYTVEPCSTDSEPPEGVPSCTALPLWNGASAADVQPQARVKLAAVPAAAPPIAPFGAAVVFVVRPPAAPPVVVTPPPTALDDVATTIAGTPVSVPVLANDSANGGGALNLSSVSAAAHGTAVIDGARIDYTPAAGFVGTDTFTYTASTPYGSSTAAVTVTVTAPTPSSTAPSTPAPTTSSAVATHSASPSPTRSLGVLPTSASRVPGPPLANTGVRTGDYLGTGAGLVAAGGLLTFAGRRRRRRAH
jgi:LPXTG-motif cell wall-anchored protein